MSIAKERCGRTDDVTIVCATKYATPSDCDVLFELGARHFGENYVTTLELRDNLRNTGGCVHFIGHLQSNKVHRIGLQAQCVDTVTSFAQVRRMRGLETPPRLAIQLNVSDDLNRNGLSIEQGGHLVEEVLEATGDTNALCGVMAMTAPTANLTERDVVFATVMETVELWRSTYHLALPVVSMGMSDDFEVAIAHGATEVRLGRALALRP